MFLPSAATRPSTGRFIVLGALAGFVLLYMSASNIDQQRAFSLLQPLSHKPITPQSLKALETPRAPEHHAFPLPSVPKELLEEESSIATDSQIYAELADQEQALDPENEQQTTSKPHIIEENPESPLLGIVEDENDLDLDGEPISAESEEPILSIDQEDQDEIISTNKPLSSSKKPDGYPDVILDPRRPVLVTATDQSHFCMSYLSRPRNHS